MKTASKTYPAFSTETSTSGGTFDIQYDIFTVGAGYLNTYAAVASNDVPSGTALSPVAVRDILSGKVALKADNSTVWNNSIVWGTSIVWGNTVNSNSIIWGSSIVWGNVTTEGFSIVWGTSIIWGIDDGGGTTGFSEPIDADRN
jgi:serine protease AprX